VTTSSERFAAGPIVLFDGVCNLCNGSVNFIIDRDPDGAIRFASLQSKAAQRLLESLGRAEEFASVDTMLLVEQGQIYDRSTAVLRTARHLSGAWRWLAAFEVIPRVLRDAVYRWIAANRYKWFGRSASCRMPTPELRARFLED
jgi:predicted DCC family thiol-disulfide oxidoreductase YuxK